MILKVMKVVSKVKRALTDLKLPDKFVNVIHYLHRNLK